MKKKILALVGAALAVSLCASLITACAPTEEGESKHAHPLRDVAAKAATCSAEGNIAHQKCDYCWKLFLDGKEVTEEDVIIPIDPNNHTFNDVAEVPAKCLETGTKAHQECKDCHKLFLDGSEVTESALNIAAIGEHSWDGLECTVGDAYKLLYNGNYYTIDASNSQEFVDCVKGNHAVYNADSTMEYPYLASALENRMTFYSWAIEKNKITNLGSQYQIGYGTGVRVAAYTNFAYGNADGSAYIGRFLMSFDLTSTQTRNFNRVGVKLVNSQAKEYPNQSKLIGMASTEENNPERTLQAGTVYRFVYAVEVTSADQLVRIYTQTQTSSGNTTNVTISNLHFISLDEVATGVPGATLCYFGDAAQSIVAKEECTHAWKYDAAERAANCLYAGAVAHTHCPQCGLNWINGEVTDNVSLPLTDHDYVLHEAKASTCVEAGYETHYQCSVCGACFDMDKKLLEGKPELPLAAHTTGEWQSNVAEHWKVCSVCEQIVEKHEHIPGPEATNTTPQTCTECGYVLVSALGHTHTMTHTEAKTATCTEGGNVEYWYCSGCEKYFADEAGAREIDVATIHSEPLGHTMNEKVEAKEATCTEGGNLAYYFCATCEKYFADEEGTQELNVSDVFIEKLGHTMTEHAASPATCYQRGNAIAYSYCSTCKKYFTDNTATTELTVEQIFTLSMTEHHFENGVCTNAGCGATQEASTIAVADESKAFGTTAAAVNPSLLANPGTWACQNTKSSRTTATIDDNGVLKITLANKSNTTENSNKAFVRIYPAKDGKVFVGTYLWSFDFKVTAITGTLSLDFAIQNEGGNSICSTDQEYRTYEAGTTYRFAVLIETAEERLYAQVGIRNGAGSYGSFEISNASLVFYPAATNLGINKLEVVTLAEIVSGNAGTDTTVTATAVAMLPDNKREYTV